MRHLKRAVNDENGGISCLDVVTYLPFNAMQCSAKRWGMRTTGQRDIIKINVPSPSDISVSSASLLRWARSLAPILMEVQYGGGGLQCMLCLSSVPCFAPNHKPKDANKRWG